MKIGILGTGDVGRALGRGFAKHGHCVKLGSRDPRQGKVKDWLAQAGSQASTGSLTEAVGHGEVVVLAVPGLSATDAILEAGPRNFTGKIVIDATNPLDFSMSMLPKLFVGHSDSLGERIQRLLPLAHIVKAFNTVGHGHMVDPDFPGGPPDMFICGNDEPAKKTVAQLLETFGWAVVDLGDIDASRYLEPLAMIWILRFFKTNNENHAFKLLHA